MTRGVNATQWNYIVLLCIFLQMLSCSWSNSIHGLRVSSNTSAGDSSLLQKVHPNLHRRLASHGSVNIMVRMKKRTVEIAQMKMLRDNRNVHIAATLKTMRKNAEEAQIEVFQRFHHWQRRRKRKLTRISRDGQHPASETNNVDADPVQIRSFWITNQVFIAQADAELVNAIAHTQDVLSVNEEQMAYLPRWTMAHATTQTFAQPLNGSTFLSKDNVDHPPVYSWGLEKLQVSQAQLVDGKGEGIVVGSIDSGVRGSHLALRDNFVGKFGWYDAVSGSKFPHDDFGHGTHTMATIVGSRGLGVAPGAQWMACKACNLHGACPDRSIYECAQFLTCPNDPEGMKNCTLAPHLISNSWGGGDSKSYEEIIEVWHQLGIIPLFSIGNQGEADMCGTATSPGDYANVISVGALDIHDQIAFFSSTGPSQLNQRDKVVIKPDVTAPGVDIVSAHHTHDDAIISRSGTSMACPHVSGIVALLLAQNPHLTFREIQNALAKGADQEGIVTTGRDCGGIPDDRFPNNVYGYGRVNAYKTLMKSSSATTTHHRTLYETGSFVAITVVLIVFLQLG